MGACACGLPVTQVTEIEAKAVALRGVLRCGEATRLVCACGVRLCELCGAHRALPSVLGGTVCAACLGPWKDSVPCLLRGGDDAWVRVLVCVH